jgi:hypothetical protein
MVSARCTPEDDELLYANMQGPDGKRTLKAKAICASCPVRRQCLVAAYEIEEGCYTSSQRFGVWGMATPSDRQHYAEMYEALGPDAVMAALERDRRARMVRS